MGPTVLFASSNDDPVEWRRRLEARLPGIDLRVPPDLGDPAEIEAAITWRVPPGELRRYPNLRLICNLGAGVDGTLADPDLPDVPIVRLVDPRMTAQMSEYVAARVLDYHCVLDAYRTQQRERAWRRIMRKQADERGVGIMGLGELGRDAACKLAPFGFDLAGWSRTPKSLPGVKNFAGDAALPAFLARTEILVCLLPLTPATEGIVGARLLSLLPRGACVINAARGRHVVDADLLAALDSGQIAHATLDVFWPEPLAPEHPFWTHPRVFVTPHGSAMTNPDTAADQVAENLRRVRAGGPYLNLVDRARGY